MPWWVMWSGIVVGYYSLLLTMIDGYNPYKRCPIQSWFHDPSTFGALVDHSSVELNRASGNLLGLPPAVTSHGVVNMADE